jgi:hypothetical protein
MRVGEVARRVAERDAVVIASGTLPGFSARRRVEPPIP